MSRENAGSLLDLIQEATGIQAYATAHPCVEMGLRHRGEERFLFLLNHTLEDQIVNDLPTGTELLSDLPVAASITLEPFGVRVIELEKA